MDNFVDSFKPENGLIHFVFARQDNYYLDSLVHFDRAHYIYYLLKQKSYEQIFFISKTQSDLIALDIDRRSREILETKKVEQNKTFSLFAKHKTLSDKLIEGAQDGRQKIAYIFDFMDFFDILQEKEFINWRNRLIEIKNDRRKKMIILVVGMPTERQIQDIFIREKGGIEEIFTKFSSVRKDINDKEFYVKFREVFEDRIVEFHPLTRRNIYNMLLYTIIVKKGMQNELLDKIEDYTDFMYLWYLSGEFRTKIQKQLRSNVFETNINEDFVLKKDSDKLSKEFVWHQMNNAIETIRRQYGNEESIYTLIEGLDQFSDINTDVNLKNKSLKEQLRYLQNKEEILNRREIKDLLKKVIEAYSDNINKNNDDEEQKRRIQKIQQCLQECLEFKDWDMLERNIQALSYIVLVDRRKHKNIENIWESYEMIFDIYINKRKKEKSISKMSYEIKAIEAEIEKVQNEIRLEEAKYRCEKKDQILEMELSINKERYINLINEKKQWRLAKNQQRQEIENYDYYIKQYDYRITSLLDEGEAVENFTEKIKELRKELLDSQSDKIDVIKQVHEQIAQDEDVKKDRQTIEKEYIVAKREEKREQVEDIKNDIRTLRNKRRIYNI